MIIENGNSPYFIPSKGGFEKNGSSLPNKKRIITR